MASSNPGYVDQIVKARYDNGVVWNRQTVPPPGTLLTRMFLKLCKCKREGGSSEELEQLKIDLHRETRKAVSSMLKTDLKVHKTNMETSTCCLGSENSRAMEEEFKENVSKRQLEQQEAHNKKRRYEQCALLQERCEELRSFDSLEREVRHKRRKVEKLRSDIEREDADFEQQEQSGRAVRLCLDHLRYEMQD